MNTQRDTVAKSALSHTQEEQLFCLSKDRAGSLPRYQEYTGKSGLDPNLEDRTTTTVHYQHMLAVSSTEDTLHTSPYMTSARWRLHLFTGGQTGSVVICPGERTK